jgi:hypothetical protein
MEGEEYIHLHKIPEEIKKNIHIAHMHIQASIA